MATPARTFGYVFGAVYLVIGLAGFAVTGFDDFASAAPEETLLGFELNPLHNLVHIAIGAALLIGAGMGEVTARGLALLIGATYALVGILGFFIIGNEDLNILNLNQADNWLHIVTAIIAFVVVAMSRRPATTARPVA